MVKSNLPGLLRADLGPCCVLRRAELGPGVAVCWHTGAQEVGAEEFWGKEWDLHGKQLALGCRRICLSCATWARKIAGFITPLVALQTFHETNECLQG